MPLTSALVDPFKELDAMIKVQRDGNLWLYHGDVGMVLYYYYRSIYLQSESDQEKALKILEEQVENVGEYLYNYKFGYGITGFAWLIQFLINQGFLAAEDAATLTEIDKYVHKTLKYNYEDRLYDLFIGSIGKGVYFFERLQFAQTQNDQTAVKEHRQRLLEIVDQLESQVHTTSTGTYWLDYYTSGYESHRDQEPYIGIGLAHGTPSIVYFLGRCVQANIAPRRCLKLIRSTVDWILSTAYEKQAFPTRVYSDGEKAKVYDLSWCYGVFSVASSLWVAGNLLKEQAYLDRLQLVLERMTQVDPETYPIDRVNEKRNIFFCHGTTGISYLFEKFYRLTQREDCRQASQRWLQASLAEIPKYEKADLSAKNNSILEGLAGVTLVMMTQQNPQYNSQWDKIFLLDLQSFAPSSS